MAMAKMANLLFLTKLVCSASACYKIRLKLIRYYCIKPNKPMLKPTSTSLSMPKMLSPQPESFFYRLVWAAVQ